MLRKPVALLFLLSFGSLSAAAPAAAGFPRALADYPPETGRLPEVLWTRATTEPFNLVATLIFALAVLHTFMTARFRHWAHAVEERHRARRPRRPAAATGAPEDRAAEVSFGGQVLHFLGEVEAVFGIWALALGAALVAFKDVPTAIQYIGQTVNYTEPIFVVVVMALASTRPVLRLAERALRAVAALGGGGPAAWWVSILTLAPLLGSLITEPAAMTIGAMLLSRQFYELQPGPKLQYATLGLLFVNISIGGTLTHFAAPPVLMVSAAWGWDLSYMFTRFGGHALTAILISNAAYFLLFRRELLGLRRVAGAAAADPEEEPVPAWVTGVHLLFLGFTVGMAHYPALFIGGFLFYLAFAQATAHHQSPLDLRGPLLVGFFLAGLVVHGGLQGWWIEPVLSRLGELPLFIGATVLTAFNDNALITYLATLVPDFTDELKFAVVAGAVTGGGLTVIANAPNPAGQSILQRHFPKGISPLGLLLGALLPTLITALVFRWL